MKEPLTGLWHVEFNDAWPKENPAEIDKPATDTKTKNKQGNGARDGIANLNKSGEKAAGDDEDEEGEEEEEGWRN